MLLFWDVTQPRLAVNYRRFGITYLEMSGSPLTFEDGVKGLFRYVGY
jgi:hypothetical protein